MMQIQLRPKGSHRHIIPVVALYFLVVAFGDIRTLTEQSHWLTAAAGLLVTVVMGIVAFYGVTPFLYMTILKESWFGMKFFGLAVSPPRLRRVILLAGYFLTYFGFVCRIWIISALEAAFLLILLAAATGSPLEPANPHSSTPILFVPLLVCVAAIHTWVERRNLGMAGLSILADRTEGWL